MTNNNIMTNDANFLYYHRGTVRSPFSGHSHFSRSDYLTSKSWIKATFLFPNTVVLTGPLVYRYKKSFRRCRGIHLIGLNVIEIWPSFISLISCSDFISSVLIAYINDMLYGNAYVLLYRTMGPNLCGIWL